MTVSAQRKALGNSTSHFVAAAIGVITGFVVMPAVVHGIGLTEFGIWALATTLIGYMGLLDLGLSQTVIKKSSERLAKEDYTGLSGMVSSILSLYLFIAISILIVCVPPLIYWGPQLFNVPPEGIALFREVFLILGALAAINFPMSIISGLVGGLQDFYAANSLSAILNVLKAALTIILLKAGYGLIALVWLAVGISVAGWLATFVWVKWRIPHLSVKFMIAKREQIREITRFSSSMFIWATAGQAYQSADRVIIGILFPVGSVGVYEIGARLNTYSRTVLHVVFMAMPAASALIAKGEFARVRDLYLQGSKYVLAVYGAIAIPTMMYGHEFVGLWIGAGFGQSVLIAQLLMIASLFQSQNSLGHMLLVGMGRLEIFTKVMAAYPIVIVCLAAGFGALLGLVGVALGVAFAVFGLEVIILVHLSRVMTTKLIDLLMSCQLPVIATGSAAAILSTLIIGEFGTNTWMHLGIKITLFEVLYGALLFAFGLSQQERKRIVAWGAAFRSDHA